MRKMEIRARQRGCLGEIGNVHFGQQRMAQNALESEVLVFSGFCSIGPVYCRGGGC